MQLHDALGNRCSVSGGSMVSLALRRGEVYVIPQTEQPPHVCDNGDGSFALRIGAAEVGTCAPRLERALSSYGRRGALLRAAFGRGALLSALRARRRYELLLWLDGVLCAQRRVEIRAGAASALGTVLVLPESGRLQPEQWNKLPLLFRDAAGNAVELVERHRLEMRVTGVRSMTRTAHTAAVSLLCIARGCRPRCATRTCGCARRASATASASCSSTRRHAASAPWR